MRCVLLDKLAVQSLHDLLLITGKPSRFSSEAIDFGSSLRPLPNISGRKDHWFVLEGNLPYLMDIQVDESTYNLLRWTSPDQIELIFSLILWVKKGFKIYSSLFDSCFFHSSTINSVLEDRCPLSFVNQLFWMANAGEDANALRGNQAWSLI